jgi:SAM-dependent methyltransferase
VTRQASGKRNSISQCRRPARTRRAQLSLEAGIGIIAGMDASSRVPATVSNRLAEWFATPLGRYLLGREQAYFDRTVADIFGFHAVQIGLPACPFLSQSRIPSRWSVDLEPPAQVLADPHWLPFPENSLDLMVIPHALEFTEEPHQLLREIYRAVRPDGQIVLSGFNPFSLFGAKRYFGRSETPPWNGSFIALYRLKDWLALLGFEVTGGSLDCYVPPFAQEMWLRRFGFFEQAGDRWWPIAGGVYFLRATKRVLGMRVITPAWDRRKNGLATAPRQARESIE